MKEFRKKNMKVSLFCTCVNDDYFDIHLRNYYDFMAFDLAKSKVHGTYSKCYYHLIGYASASSLGLDMRVYDDLPAFICTSNIYK